MEFSPDTQGGSSWTTEKMNRTTMLLTGLLLLLIFMDHQAKRHYSLRGGFSSGNIIQEKIESSLRPLPGRAEDILSEPMDRAGDTIGRIRDIPRDQKELIQDSVDEIRKIKSIEDLDRIKDIPAVERLEELEKRLNSLEYRDAGSSLHPVSKSQIDLYFIRFRSSRSEIVRVSRSINPENFTMEDSLELLKKGPSVQERGLLNPFDKSITVNSLKMEGTTAVVDLDEGIGKMSAHIVEDRIAQMALTLFQFPRVEGLRLLVNGAPVASLAGGKVKVPEIIQMPARKITAYKKQ